jgi:2-succinyl-6-hydroxy-2,4-cyclohexadiene-1-carboxylate synthase
MPESRRLVLAHGFTQTARSWHHIQELLAEREPGVETIAVDLPGHGGAAAVAAELWGAADHLVDRGGRATYVGYSMGGRVALHAALARPDQVEGLVLIGATAGIDDSTERVARRTSDDRLAERIEEIGVEAFVDEWLANPLFARLTDDTAQRDDRMRNTAHGLAQSLRSTGTGTQDPLWDRLDEIESPVLVIAGEHDDKFIEIGHRLVTGLTRGELHLVAGAGHSAHLERPDETVAAIVDWRARL